MKRVLVVDNDLLILEFMHEILSKAGHEVVTAEDGLSALDMLKTFTPDVIFVDLVMPNIEGRKLCQLIRQMDHVKDAYVVVLSAIAAEEEPNMTVLGADTCVAKGPLDEMAPHILALLEQPESRPPRETREEPIGVKGMRARRITKELLSVKRNFELILKGMSEGIVEINEQGRILYCNPKALSFFATAEGELLGSHLQDLFPEKDRPSVSRSLESMRESRKNVSLETPLNLGKHRVRLDFLPIEGEGLAGLIILNDVTEHDLMQDQLFQAKKLEAVATLAEGIAHDYNNLLTAIMGNVSLAQMYAKPGDKVFDLLTEAKNASLRAKELTERFMTYAKGGPAVKTRMFLGEFLKETVKLALSGSNVESLFTIPDGLWRVNMDKNQMTHVMNSLINNAKETMPEGGTIRVGAENIALQQEEGDPFPHLPRGNYVRISIQDQGIGIPEANLPKIFEPYFSTKDRGARRGMGLNLATCHSIVKGHGGYIDVRSREGVGSTFYIYLPSAEVEEKSEDVETEGPQKEKGRILVMDDEEVVRDVAGRILEYLGYEVAFAEDGDEAVEAYKRAKASGKAFDAVILDLTIPGGRGGKATLEEIKAIEPQVKALISSGYSSDPVVAEYAKHGFMGMVSKPYKIEELAQVLHDVIHKKKP